MLHSGAKELTQKFLYKQTSTSPFPHLYHSRAISVCASMQLVAAAAGGALAAASDCSIHSSSLGSQSHR